MEIKRHWLGQKWYLPGKAGNDINQVCSFKNSGNLIQSPLQTNVPDIRLSYRHRTLLAELNMLKSAEHRPVVHGEQESADTIGARAMAVK